MVALSPVAQDRLFIFGLGIAAVAVVDLVRRMLISYREAAVIHPPVSKPTQIKQATEDSLGEETLNTLLDSPSYYVQEGAAFLICDRALHDEDAWDTLLWHIAQPDHDLREKGLRAMIMLFNNSTVAKFDKPKTYSALVRSLEFSIKDYEHNTYDPDWDNWHLRDAAEKLCLEALEVLADNCGVEGLVKSRFIDRWLAKEPWGGSDDEGRQLNFMDSLSKSNHLSSLALPLFKHKLGRRQLENAKLLPASLIPSPAAPILQLYTSRTNETSREDTAGEDFEGMFVGENRRRRDQSSGGEHLRRRNREAMVLNDGTRPLERGDIIEREEG
ncbi:hypothetical protein B7494_g5146 [Chlorociboria aeruginascens]|nr:hypothetical protein B7494_g5146 [Chlorociboria aeruginascens]